MNKSNFWVNISTKAYLALFTCPLKRNCYQKQPLSSNKIIYQREVAEAADQSEFKPSNNTTHIQYSDQILNGNNFINKH